MGYHGGDDTKPWEGDLMARISEDTPPGAVDIIRDVGQAIKAIREQQGLTRVQFEAKSATILGRPIPVGRLTAFEAGWRDPSLLRLWEIAQVCECDVADFFLPEGW